jgi:radical SAM superfamily enzyme YgiQ (UPF0313 family)
MQWAQLSNPHSQHYDMVICTVPWTDTELPLMAPAALKPVVEKAGLSCLALDLNIEIVNYTLTHPHKDKFNKFFFEEKLLPEIEQEVYDIFDSITDQLLSFTPNYVGFSVFSYVCQAPTKWLCYFLKKKRPDIKIIIGGPGCLPTLTGSSKYVNHLLSLELIDYHVRGDAEHSLYQLLTGNDEYSGINTDAWQELTNQDLATLPMPDYSNYNFDYYNIKAVPIIGSRGCVRQCTFCDYIVNWKKFQWRTADHIFNEMVHQSQRYGVTAFKFQDSLTNGNVKEFNRLMELISNYNNTHSEKKLIWGGFYIFRERTASSEKEWEMLVKSGAVHLMVGIENFNQHIRYAIGKKFSDESIIFHLEQAQKYNIKLNFLMINGYINETQQDIEKTKQWLRDNVRFNNIINFHWGTGLSIFDNTYLGNNKEALGITMTGSNPHEWISKHTDSTSEIRARWSAELITLSKQLGYVVEDNIHDNHYLLEKSFSKNE